MEFAKDIYSSRRTQLINDVTAAHGRQGIIVLFAGFEQARSVFRQESSFYYYTGITEPGVVLVLDTQQGTTDLYIPHCDQERAKWMSAAIGISAEQAQQLGLSAIHYLGDQCVGYQFHPFFPKAEYNQLLDRLLSVIKRGQAIYTLHPDHPSAYAQQRLLLLRLFAFLPSLSEAIVDISAIVADMRRKKDMHEIELMYKAVDLTIQAQDGAAHIIEDGLLECQVQGAIEYLFTASGQRAAFPSIVASGKRATILHYHDNNQPLKNGELMVADIGAEWDYYCADITRTYPVSGTFTKRQREIYEMVLDTQTYIAELAKPGLWLSNPEKPEQSLNHLAKKYLEERGYGKYFIHGIGHFLGLDVHDVGDYRKPLQEGDVITIEPGIYIPQEGIGVRIEDDYWIVRDSALCLSESLPKSVDEIEQMVQQKWENSHDEQDDGQDLQ